MISPLMIDLKGFNPIELGDLHSLYIHYSKDSRGGSGFIHLEGMDDLIAIEQPRIQHILILYHI